jgi:hypothetical protein
MRTEMTVLRSYVRNGNSVAGWFRVVPAAVMIAVALLGHAVTLRAECVSISLRESGRRADLMFSGTVTSIHPEPCCGLTVTINVDQVWKGRVRRTTTIYTRVGSEAARLEERRRYLFITPKFLLLEFLNKQRATLDVPGAETCGWWRSYESAERELITLDRPHGPR